MPHAKVPNRVDLMIRRIKQLLIPFAISGLMAGCASDGGAGGGKPADGMASLADSMFSEDTESNFDPSVVAENGLEVRKWVVGDHPVVVGKALASLGEPAPIDPHETAALQRNGLRLWRIPLVDLPILREQLGGTIVDQQWWYGQVPEWRELHGRLLNAASRAVAVDGRVRVFSNGSFKLLIRSWTYGTEDGPRLTFEFAPVFQQGRPASYRHHVRTDRGAIELFPTLTLQTSLEPGFAYVLLPEAPSVDWTDPTSIQTARRTEGRLPRGGEVRGSIGPHTGMGPAASPATTLGEALLRGEPGNPGRGVIILVPRIPLSLFPEELIRWKSADEDASTGNGDAS